MPISSFCSASRLLYNTRLRALRSKRLDTEASIALMLAIRVSPRARIRAKRSSAAPCWVRAANCFLKSSRSAATLAATSTNALGVSAATKRGAAAARVPLCWATAKAVAISGTARSFTCLWASPTWSKENQATKLATMVRATAVPMPM